MQFEMTTVWCDRLWESHVYLLKQFNRLDLFRLAFSPCTVDNHCDGRQTVPTAGRLLRRTEALSSTNISADGRLS